MAAPPARSGSHHDQPTTGTATLPRSGALARHPLPPPAHGSGNPHAVLTPHTCTERALGPRIGCQARAGRCPP
eukprot:3133456-Prymnesium_polylepis.1